MEIGKYWFLKPTAIGPPKLYLGNKVSKVTLENGVSVWAFSLSQYVLSAISNVEKYLKARNKALPKKAPVPFTTNYRPEIDVSSTLLSPAEAAYYQSLIGILRWMFNLDVDITSEVSMMAMPRTASVKGIYTLREIYLQNVVVEMVPK